MTEQEKIEYDRCVNGHEGMTGQEYFWYNYAGGNGMHTTFSEDGIREYREEAIRMRNAKSRRHIKLGPGIIEQMNDIPVDIFKGPNNDPDYPKNLIDAIEKIQRESDKKNNLKRDRDGKTNG